MKDRAATLVAASQEKQDTIIRMNTAKPTPSRNVCEGRIKAGKEKTKLHEDDSSTTDKPDELD